MITDYESLVDKIDVISQDAYRMGRIEGVRYDPHDYNILGLIVKCEKEVSAMLNAGTSKSRILLRPDNFEVHDVLLIGETVEDAKGYKGGATYRVFVNKKKLMYEKYGIRVVEV